VNPKIAGKWMFIPLKMVLIGIDPYPSIKKTAPMDFIRVVFGAVGELIPEKTVTKKTTGGTRF